MKTNIFFLIPVIIQLIAVISLFKKKHLKGISFYLMLIGCLSNMLLLIIQFVIELKEVKSLTLTWFLYDNLYIGLTVFAWIVFALGLLMFSMKIGYKENQEIDQIGNY